MKIGDTFGIDLEMKRREQNCSLPVLLSDLLPKSVSIWHHRMCGFGFRSFIRHVGVCAYLAQGQATECFSLSNRAIRATAAGAASRWPAMQTTDGRQFETTQSRQVVDLILAQRVYRRLPPATHRSRKHFQRRH
jgi:hypothetical protein